MKKYKRITFAGRMLGKQLFLVLVLLFLAEFLHWVIADPKPASVASSPAAPKILWENSEQPGQPEKGEIVKSVTFSTDGRLLASVDAGSDIKLWRIEDGGLVYTVRQDKSGPYALAFSPDGKLLVAASGGATRNLSFYRVADGSSLRAITAHENGTNSIAFSPDGTLLASGGRDHKLRLWRVSDATSVAELNQGARIISLAFSPDGGMIAAGDSSGRIKLWRAADGAQIAFIDTHTEYVFSLAFSPTGSMLVSGGGDESLKLWALPDGKSIRSVTIPNSGTATSVAFSSDGQSVNAITSELVTSPANTMHSLGAIRSWRIADGALFSKFDQQTNSTINAIALSPNGSLLGYGRQDGGVALASIPF
jgi:WD40 repeat protein